MEITLTELLDAREDRVRFQHKMQEENKCTLVCFTMNIAGPVKTSPVILRAFNYGIAELEKKLNSFNVLDKRIRYLKTGPEGYFSVSGNGGTIKDVCIEIEESCKLGRLFDMDVLEEYGNKLERKRQRHCIVCNKEGRYCAASRAHSVTELQKITNDIIIRHFTQRDSEYIGNLAKQSLIQEVYTTPKPGLVDKKNNGSHNDMTAQTFVSSADSLFPYFKKCVNIGIETSNQSPSQTFEKLRQQGIEAEKSMYMATGGVNTHKGIIYSLGIILGAIGRLWSVDEPLAKTDLILEECAKIVKESVKKDLEEIDNSTAGGRLYCFNGKQGVRGEAASGFFSVKNISLPAYKIALQKGKNKNDAGVFALLHLIANIYDSALFNRGGEPGVTFAQNYAKAILAKENPSSKDLEQMDKDFIKENLSPGGCADLLAITYFLADIEDQRSDLTMI